MAPSTGNLYRALEVYNALSRGERLVAISPKAYKRIKSAYKAKKKLQKISRKRNRR